MCIFIPNYFFREIIFFPNNREYDHWRHRGIATCSHLIRSVDQEAFFLLSIEWNSIRLGDPAQGVVSNNVHKTLPGGWGGRGWWGSRGWDGLEVGWEGPGGGISRLHSIDLLQKLWLLHLFILIWELTLTKLNSTCRSKCSLSNKSVKNH